MKTFLEKAADYRASTNSFKFYVPTNAERQGSIDDVINKSGPVLLEKEIVITSGQRVLLFPYATERTKGVSGTLYVTTFRLCFCIYEDEQDEVPPHQKNLLIGGEHYICLSNIDSLYQLSGDKKRKLYPDVTLTGRVKGLQVVCKNMKVLTFSFDQSPMDDGRNVTNTLLHHAFPGRHQLLFAYEYKPVSGDNELKVVMYNTIEDWDQELVRTCSKIADRWRLTRENHIFQLSPSLPQWFVIPKSVLDCDLTTVSGAFRCNRPPVWTWASSSGAALVRMADLLPTITDRSQENRMLEHIRKSHPQRAQPNIKELDKELPSVRDIQVSFMKLRDLCIVDNYRQFKVQDSHFYMSLDHTKWLHCVSACLRIAAEAAQDITRGETVVLQECDGRDTCAVVSSLVQLLLDPHARTLSGFQSLIQKEWVALGHPFCKRLGHLRTSDGDQSPVFLVFLDCTWQLQNQFPEAFQFTDTYLTTLWDSTHISVFDTFLFDCEKDRVNAIKNSNEPLTLTPRSVWNWKQQFSSEDQELFFNPLFKAARVRDRLEDKPKHGARLQPEWGVPSLELWCQCYCRWQSLLRIPRGGAPQADICHRQLLADIDRLAADVADCTGRGENGMNSSRLRRVGPKEEFLSSLTSNRDVIDNFFPFSLDSTALLPSMLVNSSMLSDTDSQSVLNLTD